MTQKQKNEQVSISFHYIERRGDNDDSPLVKLTTTEFDTIFSELSKLQTQDVTSPDIIEMLKFHNSVIVKNAERVNPQTIAGVFENSYWGHSFRNSDKGDISAESLNYRPFFFLLYLSDSGRLYIVCQYLGNFGGYTALKNAVLRAIKNKTDLQLHSFNMFLAQIEKLVPTEVIFDVAKKSEAISGKNVFSQKVAIALKDKEKSGDYEAGIKDGILSLFRLPNAQIRSELAKFLKDNELMSIADDELENCRVIATINKKQITIHMLDGSNRASKFPVDVPLDKDGHPEYTPLKNEAIKLLKDKIISRKENV